MPTKPEDDEDIAHIRAAMQGVKPLKNDRVHFKPKPKRRRYKAAEAEWDEQEYPFSDHLKETVTSDTKLFFAKPGLQHKILQTLKQGKIAQTAVLDLHGETVDEARSILGHFLVDCKESGHRCVRIIHGKGKLDLKPPLLKNHVNGWLQQSTDVLAFCSALPREGGAGAIYVLLKKNR